MKNNKYIKLLTIVTIFSLLGVWVEAAGPYKRAGTSASAFLKLGTGAPEAQALGNAYTALSSGAQALFWNPAGIATSTSREIQVSHMQWFEGVGDSAVGYIQPIGKTILGVSLRYMRLSGDDLNARDPEGIPYNITGDAIRDFVATVSLGRTFFGVLDIGGTAKYINEDNVGVKHINPAFDIGGKLRISNNRFVIGVMGQNLGDPDEVPSAIRGGAAINTKYFTVSGEIVDYVDDKLRYGVGLAIHIPEDLVQVASFDIRVGYYNRENTGWAEDGDIAEKIGLETTSKVTLGFGFYSSEVFGYGLGLDYTMMPSGALGTAHQLAVRLQF
ncbi:UPF0164 family protein [Candidatus Proelusimicrobium volucris]|uniref:UPF0164 family protein n=1 Tax=Candidatus Proelusimicrobium volucris TaxID=3416225 RepID=UPI003D11E54C